MAFEKPKLFYNNALRDAQTGNDGTTLATCVTCIADAADPNKVRGEFVKAADVPNLDMLKGCGIVFDTTKNEYRITDSAAAMRKVGSILDLASGENAIYALAIYAGYLYVGCNTVPGKIAKINLNSMQEVGTSLTLAAGENGIYSLVVDSGFLYAGLNLSPAKIAKVDISTFLEVGSALTLAAGENLVSSLVVDAGFLYAGLNLSPAKIAKIDLNTFLEVGSALTLAAGENNAGGMATTSGYLYVGCQTTPGKIAKINLTTFLEVGIALTLAAGENNAFSIAVNSGYLYIGCLLTPSKIAKIDLTTFLEVGTALALASGEDYSRALSASGGYLYVGCGTAPGKIAKVNLSTFLEVGSALTLAAGENTIYALIVDSDYIYVGTQNTPGKIAKIDPKDYFKTFERLQTADIGTSFKVRAGLTCAQCDPTRPVMYAADGHLSPRMKGTVNTALYLRAHAPNFIEDGGFETGAFSPNWTAGANWAINTANKLEGAYSAAWDTAANNNLIQSRTNKLIKGKTYRIIVKTKALTGNAAANCLTITPKQAGSGTSIYAAISGNAIAPTTTATWTEFDIVPDFETNNWELWIVPLLANKGSATAIIVDEIYLYEKKTLNTLIVGKHNWGGHGAIVVKAWRVSPLRSTAASDANNYTQLASFTPDTSDNIIQALTSSVYPIVEIALPAAATWTPDAGDISIGDYWQVPVFPKPMDPYKTNKDKLRELSLDLQRIAPALRLTNIADLYDKIRSNEAMWAQWNSEIPFLVESADNVCDAPYDPYAVKLMLKLIERL